MKVVVGLVGPPLAGKETVGNIGMKWAELMRFSSKRHRYRDVLEETLRILNKAKRDGCFFEHRVCTDVIGSILERWSLEKTGENINKLIEVLGDTYGFGDKPVEIGRESLQIMAQIMVRDDTFGENTLAYATGERLVNSLETIVWGDGVRWLADEKYLRGLPNSKHPDVKALVLYVSASEEVRFKRLRQRMREGEATISFEKFLEQGRAKNEICIPEIGSRADLMITNNHEPSATLTDEQAQELLRRDVFKFCHEKIFPLVNGEPLLDGRPIRSHDPDDFGPGLPRSHKEPKHYRRG